MTGRCKATMAWRRNSGSPDFRINKSGKTRASIKWRKSDKPDLHQKSPASRVNPTCGDPARTH
jgi:hypothetical protein